MISRVCTLLALALGSISALAQTLVRPPRGGVDGALVVALTGPSRRRPHRTCWTRMLLSHSRTLALSHSLLPDPPVSIFSHRSARAGVTGRTARAARPSSHQREVRRNFRVVSMISTSRFRFMRSETTRRLSAAWRHVNGSALPAARLAAGLTIPRIHVRFEITPKRTHDHVRISQYHSFDQVRTPTMSGRRGTSMGARSVQGKT